MAYCRRQRQNNILFKEFFVWTSCSRMLGQRKTTCWLNNVVQTWYNMLFRHDEVTRLNNHVTTLVNMVVLSLVFSPVPTAMNSYCWFIIAEQCCWNNSEQHCWPNSVATSCAIFGCDILRVLSLVNVVKRRSLIYFYWLSGRGLVGVTPGIACNWGLFVLETWKFILNSDINTREVGRF